MHRRPAATLRAALLTSGGAAVALLALVLAHYATPAVASQPQLTRYPYLTDVVSTGTTCNATINWATDQSQSTGYATYGKAGVESATAHPANAGETAMTVNGVAEYQWKANVTGLLPGTTYLYRVFFSGPTVDLLGTDGDLSFTTPPADTATPYSFAVLGDWGSTNQSTYQANLDSQIAKSPASFVLSVGDVAYPSGSQTNYGDLYQYGSGISAVFGPSFYPQIGMSRSMFATPGNHGFNATMLNVWPEASAAALSVGSYQMGTYSVPGTNTKNYPSVWYAFTVGSVRYYLLTAAWDNNNVGSGTMYSADYQAHWIERRRAPSSPEYQWLVGDLAANANVPVKIAVFHFPMYTDNNTETTDTYLHGSGSLAALLTKYNVQLVFNGHAHIYERNYQQPGESFVSYVTGGGGETLEPIGTKHAYDAYSLGWSNTSNSGSAGGSAPIPTSRAQVFSFLFVTVSGTTVTVQPIDSLGEPFDGQTYNF